MIIWWSFCFVIVGAFAVDFCWFICIAWVFLMVLWYYCLLLLICFPSQSQIVTNQGGFSLALSASELPLVVARDIQMGTFDLFIGFLICNFQIHFIFARLSWFWLEVLKIPKPPAFKHFCSGIRGLLSTLTSSEILWEPHTTSTKLYWFSFTSPFDYLLRHNELRPK